MFEYIKKHKRFCEDGVEVLRFCASFPQFENCAEINGFYDTIAENCLKYCEDTLFPKMRQAYIEDPDEKKRFRFGRLTYEINIVVLNVANGVASVRVDIKLFGKNG